MEDFKSFYKYFSETKDNILKFKGLPAKTFKDFEKSNNLNEDVLSLSKAFTSIISTIINTKIDIALDTIQQLLKHIDFLQTYDDKYLSNMPNVINKSFNVEKTFLTHITSDIITLNNYLEKFLALIAKKGDSNNE